MMKACASCNLKFLITNV